MSGWCLTAENEQVFLLDFVIALDMFFCLFLTSSGVCLYVQQPKWGVKDKRIVMMVAGTHKKKPFSVSIKPRLNV